LTDNPELFAAVIPGLEGVLERELRKLGAPAIRKTSGGVAFAGGLEWIYRSNLHLRTASRVLLRVASFYAENLKDLARSAGQIPWESFLNPALPVIVKVSSKRSRVKHTGAVEERFRAAISKNFKLNESVPGEHGSQLMIRLNKNLCTVSLDTSGPLLHQRGYRQNLAKAPLRENLAAGILESAGWTGAEGFVDPMCGSGTLAIEAALLAAGIAPGLGRDFAFMSQPHFDESLWTRIRDEASEARIRPLSPIAASDRDAGAVAATRENAERAGVLDFIDIEHGSLSAARPPCPRGLWLSNPPYGKRIGQKNRLRDLYAAVGNVVRAHFSNWNIGLVSTDKILIGHTQLGMKTATPFLPHGGLKVQLFFSAPSNPEL